MEIWHYSLGVAHTREARLEHHNTPSMLSVRITLDGERGVLIKCNYTSNESLVFAYPSQMK